MTAPHEAPSRLALGTMCIGTISEIEASLDAAARAGFEYVQLSALADFEASQWLHLIEASRRRGLKVAALGSYMNLLEPDSPRLFGTTVRSLRSAAEALTVVKGDPGVKRNIVIWAGTLARGGLLEGHPDNGSLKTWDRALDTVLTLLTPVLDAGSRLLFEPYFTHFLGTPRDYRLFFREIERRIGFTGDPTSSPVGVVLDPPNFVDIEGLKDLKARLHEAIETLAPYVGLVHFKDIAPPTSAATLPDSAAAHPDLPAPGGGVIDYPWYVRTLAFHVPPGTVSVAEHFPAADVAEQKRIYAFLSPLLATAR